jgi:hypothetical protein
MQDPRVLVIGGLCKTTRAEVCELVAPAAYTHELNFRQSVRQDPYSSHAFNALFLHWQSSLTQLSRIVIFSCWCFVAYISAFIII